MPFGIVDPILLVSLLILVVLLYFHDKMYGYWEKRGIPFLRPSFSVQNIPKYVTATLDGGKFYEEIKRRNDKLSGVFNMLWPTLLVIHPDYITDILSEYLHGHFVDKGYYYTKKQDAIPANLTVLDGKNWKDMRAKLNPDYDSEEMKYMLAAVLEISENLIEAVEKHAVAERDIDVKEFLACYTADLIRYSVYQQKCNGFKYSEADAERRTWGLFQTSIDNMFMLIQEIRTMLGLPTVDDSTYYYYAIREDMLRRQENKDCYLIQRLMELMFEMDESLTDTVFPEVLFKMLSIETPHAPSAYSR